MSKLKLKIYSSVEWSIAVPYRNGSGHFITASMTSYNRKIAQDKAVQFYYNGRFTWKQLYRKGFRAIRVQLKKYEY